MLRGATRSAKDMAGTAVLRIVVSSDSIKKATATSHGKRRLEASEGSNEDGGAINWPDEFIETAGKLIYYNNMLADVSNSRFLMSGTDKTPQHRGILVQRRLRDSRRHADFLDHGSLNN